MTTILKTWKARSIVTGLLVLIFLVTAIAKVVALITPGRVLLQPDPVFGFLRIRDSVAIAAVVEVITAYFLIYGATDFIKAEVSACLSSVFLGYRLQLWLVGYKGPCNCLGKISDIIALDPSVADLVSQILVLFVAGASYFLLFASLREMLTSRQPKDPSAPGPNGVSPHY